MPIDSKIRNIIELNGHIKIDDMMREVLSINTYSYYKSIKNIGSQGDFITSPEISQLFGEIICLWAIEQWQRLGKPKQFLLIELGPGQGKLMRDFLTASKVLREFLNAAIIYLYDINPYFVKKQKDILHGFKKNIEWIENFNNIPKLPTIIIANEFFDSLPIKQYIKIKDTWFENVLVINPMNGQIGYSKIELHKALQEQLKLDHTEAKDGAVIEESIESLNIVRELSKHIFTNTGSALIIDYGYDIDANDRKREQYNSTLQAVKNHQYCPIISTLGEADITAHVDFNAFKKASMEYGINSFKVLSQSQFLLEYGIELRSNMLKEKLPETENYIIDNQVDRLISASQMGELFKTLQIRRC